MEEVCDGIDNDCDGEREENLEFIFGIPMRTVMVGVSPAASLQ